MENHGNSQNSRYTYLAKNGEITEYMGAALPLDQWPSVWGTSTSRGFAKTSYVVCKITKICYFVINTKKFRARFISVYNEVIYKYL
jgi:hypothetical protein